MVCPSTLVCKRQGLIWYGLALAQLVTLVGYCVVTAGAGAS
jgi:hypothetical protein